MSAMQDVEWEECLLPTVDDPEQERVLRKTYGFVPPGLRYFMSCPWISRIFGTTDVHKGQLVHLDSELADLVMLVVSQDNSCRYCFASQRTMMRLIGFAEDQIQRLETDFLTADLDERTRAALRFAKRLSRSSPAVDESDFETLRKLGFSMDEIRELVWVVVVMSVLNRMTTLPAIPPKFVEEIPDRFFVRALRPVIKRVLRRQRHRGTPERLSPERIAGPFAYAVQALDGLPAAGALRTVVDDAWASPLLPRRAKALVCAVVARSLECPLGEAEAARLLAEEGLPPERLDEILQQLSGPELDPLETTCMQFARETVWYRAAPIQRRAREVRDRIGVTAFVDLIGIASLANGLCRIGVIVDDR